MKKLNWWLMLAAVPVLLSGCIDSAVQVDVNKDGSARVTCREYYSPQIEGMTASMTKAMGATNTTASTDPLETFKKQIEKRRGDLGEGATLVASQAQTNAAGWKGYVAVYAVKDINKAKVRLGGESSDNGLTFRFTPKVRRQNAMRPNQYLSHIHSMRGSTVAVTLTLQTGAGARLAYVPAPEMVEG